MFAITPRYYGAILLPEKQEESEVINSPNTRFILQIQRHTDGGTYNVDSCDVYFNAAPDWRHQAVMPEYDLKIEVKHGRAYVSFDSLARLFYETGIDPDFDNLRLRIENEGPQLPMRTAKFLRKYRSNPLTESRIIGLLLMSVWARGDAGEAQHARDMVLMQINNNLNEMPLIKEAFKKAVEKVVDQSGALEKLKNIWEEFSRISFEEEILGRPRTVWVHTGYCY